MQKNPMQPFGPVQRGGDPAALSIYAGTTIGAGAALQAEPKRHKERTLRVEVNSADRDVCAYPSPVDFVWPFPFPVKNVKSARLVGGTVPLPLYTIDTPWNSFTFDTGAAKVAVTFPPGIYTEANLPAQLKLLLDAADGSNTYTVAVDPITKLLSVTTSGVNIFGFLFGTGVYLNEFSPGLRRLNCPNYALGFVDMDAYSVAGVLTGRYAVALAPLSRMYVYVNFDATMDLRSVLRGGGQTEPTAILYCANYDTLTTNIKSLNVDSYEFPIEPHVIIPRIRNLHVSLRDEYGNVLNTNNRPVTLVFELTVLD
jgi:hypothetical protein